MPFGLNYSYLLFETYFFEGEGGRKKLKKNAQVIMLIFIPRSGIFPSQTERSEIQIGICLGHMWIVQPELQIICEKMFPLEI